MSAPTPEDRFESLWSRFANEHPGLVSYSGDEAVFAPETPREVLDSYEFWVKRMKTAGYL